VVVVAAIVIVAILYFTGIGPFATQSSSGGGGGTTSGQTFSQAVTAAEAVALTVPGGSLHAATVAGGPWTLFGGGGLQLGSTASVSTAYWQGVVGASGCAVTLLPGASTITSIPGTSSTASSGLSAVWGIDFFNATGGVLLVYVLNGVATPIGTAPAEQCLYGSVTEIALPSNYADSSAVAATAWSNGGSAFASSHSSYDTEFGLGGPEIGPTGHYTAPLWTVILTTCNAGATGGVTLNGQSPAEFYGFLNGTTGAWQSGFDQTFACPSY
jgi:hypothetical protein